MGQALVREFGESGGLLPDKVVGEDLAVPAINRESLKSLVPAELGAVLRKVGLLGRCYLVGGCVRDGLLGREAADVDIEVFGMDYDGLVKAFAAVGRTDLVGRSFGVVKLTTRSGTTYDFTIPRRDSKVAKGHRGFEVSFDPKISPQEAAMRRDYTFNALMFDPATGELLDFFGGQQDLREGILRHTSPAFVEDPLRVLRGMQFAARFGLRAAPETVTMSRRMKDGFQELAVERVRGEWFKWASEGTVPSAGLRFLNESGWVDHFPELADLRATPQDPEWHPEGDVWVHTGYCCDALVQLPGWRKATWESRVVYSLAVLTHDMGKPQTTEKRWQNGRLRVVSPGHESAGRDVAESFLNRIDAPKVITRRVLPLVNYHLAHLQASTDRAVRRLARKLEPETIEGLCLIVTADHMGRPPKPALEPETVRALRSRAAALRVEQKAPDSILKGRHLLPLGMQPGPELGRWIKRAYQAQLDGEFQDLDQALDWFKVQMRKDIAESGS